MKKDGPLTSESTKKIPNGARAPRSRVREDLATELFTVVKLALDRFGVSREEQNRARRRAGRLDAPPAVSGPLLRDARGLGDLLLEWSRAPEYLDRHGNPRVLLLEGTGHTFEALVKRFMPTKSISEAVAIARATTEISLRPGGKIALLGGILVKLTDTMENMLAHSIRHVDQLLATSIHNKRVHENEVDAVEGRMERMVIGVILRERYPDLMTNLRPQIYDLLERVDSAVEQCQPASLQDLTRSTALGIGIYISQEDDWERAGIDPQTVIKTTPDGE
jgi:hypothetical protein